MRANTPRASSTPDIEPLDQRLVTAFVRFHEVVEELASLRDQLQKAAPGMVVLDVALEMAGQVVDPFAGGSVRGIVAGSLGLRYWGSDLRAEQIAANDAQADEIGTDPRPVWVCGDSMDTLGDAPDADLVFSCPPYGDLERYSDDPRDLSSMEWHTFTAAYRRIIMRAVRKLKENRFACFVVGDFRDPRGFMRGFVGETIAAFEEQRSHLYNEAILLTSVGSA